MSQAEVDELAEENEVLLQRISQLELAEEEFHKNINELEDEKEVLAKKSKAQEKKLEEIEQTLKETEGKLHEAEDLLHEHEEREQGGDDPEMLATMNTNLAHVRAGLAAAHRRNSREGNSREGRRKTSIMMGQDVEIEESQAKIFDLEDQLKASREEVEMLQSFKVMNEKLQQDRRDDAAKHGQVKEALDEQIKHFGTENRKLREANTDLQNEIAAAREEAERQAGNANLGADESSGTGDVTPPNHRNSFFCLSNDMKDQLVDYAASEAESHDPSTPSTDPEEKIEELNERLEEVNERLEQARKETEVLKEDHEVVRTELSQVLSMKRSLEEELRVKLEELKHLSASNQQLQRRCDSQHMELGRVQTECTKHLARATSAEKHPVKMNIVSPSITSPFFKLSAKISNLQQQLERAKHSENELRSQVLK